MPSFCLKDHLKPSTCVPLIFLAAFSLTLPIFINGIPKGNDLQQHFQFAVTFYNSILQGDFVPSLSTATNFGFGDIGVRFYPPLSYYAIAVFRMVTGSWHNAAAINFLFWFFLGGLGIYLWSREYFSNAASLTAAMAYMIAPYHVNEVYNASFFAEFAGAGVLPFCFLFVTRLCKNTSPLNVAGLAVAYAALVLTHLPTAVIGSAGLLVFAPFSLKGRDAFRTVVSLAASVSIGLMLSAFYWIKVVTELPLVNHSGAEFIAKNYDFKFNFVASYFYVAADTYNDRFLWMSDLMFLVALGLFMPSILFRLFSKSDNRSQFTPALAVLGLGIFMATPLSVMVWENVSFFQKIQFPFRWMVLINLAGAFLVAAGFKPFTDAFAARIRPLAVLSAGLMAIALAFTAAQVIRPALFIPKEIFNDYVSGLASESSYACWLAVWASDKAFIEKERVTARERRVSVTRWDEYEKHFDIVAGREQTARLAVFYYPFWKAESNGAEIPITPGEDGAIHISLPPDASSVKVFFQEPLAVRTAGFLSLSSWLAVLAFFAVLFFRRSKNYVNSNSNRELV